MFELTLITELENLYRISGEIECVRIARLTNDSKQEDVVKFGILSCPISRNAGFMRRYYTGLVLA